MRLRDGLNTESGYQEIISLNDEYIVEKLDEIKKLNEYELKGIQLHKRPNLEAIRYNLDDIFKYRLENIITSYSIGKTMSELIVGYNTIIPMMKDCWRKSNGYIQMVWLLSMGIMLEAEKDVFIQLAECTKKDNPNDYLIDFLIHSRIPAWEVKSSQFFSARPYLFLEQVIAVAQTGALEQAKTLLLEYLKKKWYRGHSDCGWYNDHKSEWAIHSGYWSFESGALVKILGLDDSDWQDLSYYPYDMVHYKDSNK
ncbi:PoNe immunity protein domain-containing protein [Bacteroides heparinolyticus]|uniref:PoNe immunity protein domain-containing protein n=1 Tax=Prevotella heparinolytica TaxID=28113 RepID=UPI0035A0A677